MTKKLRKVRIDRSRWVNASNSDTIFNQSALLNDQGNMCCLGFTINQVTKCNKNDFQSVCNPSDFFKKESFLTKVENGKVKENDFAEKAININDGVYDHKERESSLKKLFRKNGIILEFYGDYNDAD